MAQEPNTDPVDPKSVKVAPDPSPEGSDIPAPLPATDHSRILAEKTASPLSYQTLLLKRYLEQSFSINKHIAVTFRSLSAGMVEFLFLRLSESHGSVWSSIFDEALRIRYVAAALQKIGDNAIGDDLDAALLKSSDDAAKVLEARVKYVQSLPSNMVYLLYAHYMLFNQRVDKFIKGDGSELGNS